MSHCEGDGDFGCGFGRKCERYDGGLIAGVEELSPGVERGNIRATLGDAFESGGEKTGCQVGYGVEGCR